MRKMAVVAAMAAAMMLSACSPESPAATSSTPPAEQPPAPVATTPPTPTPTQTLRSASGTFTLTAVGEVVDMSQGETPPGSIKGVKELSALVGDTTVTVTRLQRTTLRAAQQLTSRECRKAAAPVQGKITTGELVHLDGAAAMGCSVTIASAGSQQQVWYFSTAHAYRVYVIVIQTSGKASVALPRIANNWHWAA